MMTRKVPLKIMTIHDVHLYRKSLTRCRAEVVKTSDPVWQWEVYAQSGGPPLGRFRTMGDAMGFAGAWYAVEILRKSVIAARQSEMRYRQLDLLSGPGPLYGADGADEEG